MSDLRELYQDVILDHYRHPRHSGRLESPSHQARGDNPLCGDRLAVTARVAGGRVEEVAVESSGCAISTASASLMSEATVGLTLPEVEALARRFQAILVEGADFDPAELGSLAALTGVRDYPVRIKCATLAWHTLRAALAAGGEEKAISTE